MTIEDHLARACLAPPDELEAEGWRESAGQGVHRSFTANSKSIGLTVVADHLVRIRSRGAEMIAARTELWASCTTAIVLLMILAGVAYARGSSGAMLEGPNPAGSSGF